MLINASQIDQASLAVIIQQTTSGAAFSGNMVNYAINSGYMGPTVLWVTGGAQDVTGQKRFLDSPRVPYSGGTGAAPSARWVNDQIVFSSGGLNSLISQTNINLAATGANLLTLMVNMSGALTGQGGGGGGTGSNVSVTGSLPISTPNFTGVDAITVTYDGINVIVSGSSLGGGGGSPDSVTTTGTYVMAGTYTFSGSPFVPVPTQPSGAVNLIWTSGVSGVLAVRDLAISGALQTAINTVNSTIIYTGSYINTGIITGNFNIASFFIDPVITGLNIVESFVGGMGYYFTGAAFSCRTSGFGPVNGGILSGKLYQVDSNNTEQTLFNFTFTSGIVYSGSPSFNTYITGRNRIGLSITNSLSGIQKMCVGIFGGTYV